MQLNKSMLDNLQAVVIGHRYDYVFIASGKAILMYRQIGCENVYFLPFACEPTIHRKLSQEGQEKYESDVVFVGAYTPKRARLIKALERAKVRVEVYGPYWKYFEKGPHIHDGIYGPEMVKVFNKARIVLNIHMDEDLAYKVNMRTFEATGSGAFLLTDRAYGIERLFDDNGDLIVYDSINDLTELVKYYLVASEERRSVGIRAQINWGPVTIPGGASIPQEIKSCTIVVKDSRQAAILL